jgi:hypothetical protein
MLPAGDHMRTKAKPVILPARVYSPNAAVTGVAQRRYLVLSAAIRFRNDSGSRRLAHVNESDGFRPYELGKSKNTRFR